MIARLKGKVVELIDGGAIVDVGGVGYEVVLPLNFRAHIKLDQEQVFYIAESIKEDEHTLFGLPSIDSRSMYYKLTSVNGVGPKAAISILSAHQHSDVQDAILNDDIHLFSSISGIGKKTAQRIILELKGKLVESSDDSEPADDQAFQALVSLGYSTKDAKLALKNVDKSLPTQERIKLGLKGVGK